jgi:hypothetical protein
VENETQYELDQTLPQLLLDILHMRHERYQKENDTLSRDYLVEAMANALTYLLAESAKNKLAENNKSNKDLVSTDKGLETFSLRIGI